MASESAICWSVRPRDASSSAAWRSIVLVFAITSLYSGYQTVLYSPNTNI